jgi:hypothetical protein
VLKIASRKELTSYFAGLDPAMLRSSGSGLATLLDGLPKGDSLLEFTGTDPDRGQVPSKIYVRGDDLEDFFAWSSTYVESLSPLTGFVEVVTREEARSPRNPRSMSARERGSILAATLMDGLLQSKSRLRIPDAILPATLRTLSAVFAQAIAAGSSAAELADATTSWATVRAALQSLEMPFDVARVLSFWGIVFPAFTPASRSTDADLTAAVERYLAGENVSGVWSNQRYRAELGVDVEGLLQMPREERMKVVDEQLNRLTRSRLSPETQSAIGGYLLAAVADGDFSLWPTAADAGTLHNMPLWFAFFVGGWERSNALSFNHAIGRRLQALLQYRNGDIDVDVRELLVSRRLKTRSAVSIDFPLSTLNVLKTRLAFGVCGWFSIRDREAAPMQPQQAQAQKATTEAPMTSQQFQMLRNAVEQLNLILANISLTAPAATGRVNQLELNVQPKSPTAAAPKRKRSR